MYCGALRVLQGSLSAADGGQNSGKAPF